jgi:hypothetical protein
MAVNLPAKGFYSIRAPQNFKAAIRADVELLHSNKAYLSLTTIIMCCIDALAAGTGDATRPKFESYVLHHFPDLCRELATACKRHNGAGILYSQFRNGFAHLRGPKAKFAIAEDHELQGRWADTVKIPGHQDLVAINIDRLAKEFLQLL